MEKREGYGFFFTLVAFSLVLLLLDRNGFLSLLRTKVEGVSSPIEEKMHSIGQSPLNGGESATVAQESRLRELEKENADLRSQLGVTQGKAGGKLLLAHVLSTSRFFIVDKGAVDGVKIGQSAIIKDILIGRVLSVSGKVSRVLLSSEKDSVLQGETWETQARGLVRGEGDGMLFSDVLLTDKLAEGDTVETVGNVDEKGVGIRPHLLIGTVSQIRKSSNQLFWEAKIVPFIDFGKLEDVFVLAE
jgi:rod shape-determining protein MreC